MSDSCVSPEGVRSLYRQILRVGRKCTIATVSVGLMQIKLTLSLNTGPDLEERDYILKEARYLLPLACLCSTLMRACSQGSVSC